MKLQQLRYAVEIESSGSITKAAANLFMSQPNLTNALKELESEIGVTVFSRTPKGVEPTVEGLEFLTYARSVLSEVDRMEFIFQDRKRNVAALNVAYVRSSYFARALCDQYLRVSPTLAVSAKMIETTPMKVLEAVARSEADLGHVLFQEQRLQEFSQYARKNRLVLELMWKAKMYVLLPACSPLAGEEVLTTDMLKGYTHACYSDIQYDSIATGEVKRCLSVNDRGAMLDVLSICPDAYAWTVSTHLDVMRMYNLIAKPCEDAPSVIEAFVFSKGRPRTGDVLWLLDRLKSAQRGEYLRMQEPFQMETVL